MKKRDFRNLAFGVFDRLNGFLVDPQQTLIINGFWRSGTTWLQEYAANLLRAKRIFEPFQARAGYILGCLDEISPVRRDYGFCNGLMPFISSEISLETKLFDIINQAQRGQLTSKYVLRDQRLLDFDRCFKKQVVVKYVRGSLSLRAMANTFSCPVIHIYRDPRAVIASIKQRKNWGEGAFTNFSLCSHLLEVDDGRYDYFKRWKNEIYAMEKTEDLGRLAAYYCLTEQYLSDSFSGEFNGRFACVRYEDLVINGYSMLDDILRNLDLKPYVMHVENLQSFSNPSTTQYQSNTKSLTLEDRLFGWKSKLNNNDAEVVTSVVETFGMRNYLTEPADL